METKKHMWLGKQVGFGIIRHHLDASGELGRLRRKRDVLRSSDLGLGVAPVSSTAAGGLMTCPDGLKAPWPGWTDAPPPETPGYRRLHDLLCTITSFA